MKLSQTVVAILLLRPGRVAQLLLLRGKMVKKQLEGKKVFQVTVSGGRRVQVRIDEYIINEAAERKGGHDFVKAFVRTAIKTAISNGISNISKFVLKKMVRWLGWN